MKKIPFPKINLRRNKTVKNQPVAEIARSISDVSQPSIVELQNEGWNGNPVTSRHGRAASGPWPESPESFRGPAELNAWSAAPFNQPQQFRPSSMEENWNMVIGNTANENHVTRRPVASGYSPAAPPAYGPGGGVAVRERSDFPPEKDTHESMENSSIAGVRQLRELIRERYASDLELWKVRNTHRSNHKIIQPKCVEADRILQKIYFIVNSWDQRSFTEEEWEMVKNIKACLQTKGQPENEPAYWESLPPWERKEQLRRY